MGDSYVEKYGLPADIEIEALKLARAGEIGASTGLFRAPKVFGVDLTVGALRMEKIPDLRGIRRAGLGERQCGDMVEKAGQALAHIHACLVLPDEKKRLLPAPFDVSSGRDAFLHGDYSVENVAVVTKGESHELVLIDWQASDRIGGRATFGPAFFDIAWFLGNLFRKPVFRYPIDPHVDVLADRFLEGYVAVSNANLAGLGDYLEMVRKQRKETLEAELPGWKKLLLGYGFSKWAAYAETLNKKDLT